MLRRNRRLIALAAPGAFGFLPRDEHLSALVLRHVLERGPQSHAPLSARRPRRRVYIEGPVKQTLRDFPQKGRPWGPDPAFRELTVNFGARGYVIRYRERAGQVVIVRVWHARENR